jgi:pantetheine-phosphate adenylyltransferase
MTERVAIYPGSFDPPTLGHFDLIQRAVKMFDRVIVAIATNPDKNSLFPVEERAEMLQELVKDYPTVSIDFYHGLTVEFARRQGAIAILRGLRVISDFEFELTMAINNHKLNPEVDSVLLMPSEQYLFLSSRLVREIAMFGGNVSHFVTPEVEARLVKKFAPSL